MPKINNSRIAANGNGAIGFANENEGTGAQSTSVTSSLEVGGGGIKGDRGPPGPPGASGTPGIDGKDAYQVAVDLGFSGNRSAWLLSLKGMDGAAGRTGDAGERGATGPTGSQGNQGPKGDTGNQGPKGDTGNQGPQGVKGDIGLTGSQGAKGDVGAAGADVDPTVVNALISANDILNMQVTSSLIRLTTNMAQLSTIIIQNSN